MLIIFTMEDMESLISLHAETRSDKIIKFIRAVGFSRFLTDILTLIEEETVGKTDNDFANDTELYAFIVQKLLSSYPLPFRACMSDPMAAEELSEILEEFVETIIGVRILFRGEVMNSEKILEEVKICHSNGFALKLDVSLIDSL